MSDLSHSLNWRRHNARLTASGQPSEAEITELAHSGVRCIINLGPCDNGGALTDERGAVAKARMAYV